jgi:site-specific DNA recombinase
MAGTEVQVIKATEGPIVRDRRLVGTPLTLKRKRVAAYVRVSTDGEKQLQSFQSQKQYYQDKISKNKEWAMVGIYADEGITGTKTDKRDEFLRMIEDCMNGQIDVVITKSISRFSRNLVDTLTYTRMLKQKGVTVIFEKENIDTSTMESEMQLSLLSALAQNEVESLSQNVKMGVQYKMARGELMGFNGCLGYDYNPEDKSISVNPAEAETVQLIFDLYIQGYGANTIAKRLTELGKVNKKGIVKWTDSGVRGIIKNEKYKGDLLMGKTYTVDPISKRRLENRGEENQYYTKKHHEAIVLEEVWNTAQEICQNRYRSNSNVESGTRTKYARKFAFSSMCECGFCGTNLTRRSHHQDTQHKKPVWKCRVATNKGIENCPNSKAIDESIIENAFLEMFGLLADNFDDVLESVLSSVEETVSKDESSGRLKQVEKDIASLEKKRNKLTDMMLDDKISKEAYDEKYEELNRKLKKANDEKDILSQNVLSQKNIQNRMRELRAKLAGADVLDKFDRVVFESIVQKVIVGEVAEDGTVDPYKLTFVLKGMDNEFIPDAKNRYKNLHKQAI